MTSITLEHKVLGPGNFVENVGNLKRWDSVREMSSIRAGKPLDNRIELPEGRSEEMQGIWLYGGDAVAYSIQDGQHFLELYDANNPEHIPDKSKFISTLRGGNDYRRKLPNLEDNTKRINLSDKKFNEFVTNPKDSNYSYITFKITDAVQGKEKFEEIYGSEATKLFTALHGEDVYSEDGIKGRFKESPKSTNVYFLNKNFTEGKLEGEQFKEMKLLRGACLNGLGDDSNVGLGSRFDDDSARVSGVVERAAEGGDEKLEPTMAAMVPHKTAISRLQNLVQANSPLYTPLEQFVDGLYKAQ